jgi:hypothetical protein
VPTVLYLHGFASSPEGRKVTMLRELLEHDGFQVIAPDLNQPSFERLDFEAMVTAAVDAAKASSLAVVVGSSLGAMVSLEAARRGMVAPLLLIAPALGFGARWTEKLAPGDPVTFFHHGKGRDLSIHRCFFEQMAQADSDREPPAVPVTIVMGEQDESVPFDGVLRVWQRWEASGRLAKGSAFIAIPGGDHSLIESVDRIAGEIRRLSSGTGEVGQKA